MPGKNLSYSTTNDLEERLLNLQERVRTSTGKKPNLGTLEKELSKFCDVSADSIRRIKKGLNQPSLPVALKIAKFFEVSVNDMFKLVDSQEGRMKCK